MQWIERREEQFKQKTGEFVLDWPNQILEMEENRLRGMLSAEEKALLAAKEKALFPAEEKSESPAAADAESGVNVESIERLPTSLLDKKSESPPSADKRENKPAPASTSDGILPSLACPPCGVLNLF